MVLAACQQVKSSNPLSPTIAGPIAGVVISAPQAAAPAANAQIAIGQQPVTLTIQNATTNGVRPLSYVFDIASDAVFQSILFSQSGVTPGANGQTSFQLAQTLPPGTYYWRAHAQDGANTGTFASSSFTIIVPVVIQPPTPVSPANGSTLTSSAVTLVINDSSRSGPAGPISYSFQLASDPNIGNLVASGQVPESANQTSYGIAVALSASTTYYWRVQASDPSHVSAFSPVVSFTTPAAAPAPTPPAPSTPPPGQTDTLTNAIVMNNPTDLGSWPVTTTITNLQISAAGMTPTFSTENGPGRWPDIIPPGFTGPIEFTLGMCMNISGQWYCSAPILMWNGENTAGGPPSQYDLNWFYDPVRWGPMSSHQPAVGETIGVFVAAGALRNLTSGVSSVRERSNVVLITMPSDAGASFTFSVKRKAILPIKRR